MPAMFRVPRTLPTPWFGGGLVLATLIALGAGTQRPRSAPQAAPGGRRIVVTSLSAATDEPGRITLPAAMARAAGDPADNLIEFDPALSPTAEMVIRLNGPLALDGQDGGHDRIDGGGAAAGVVIEFSAQAEAGLVIGGNRKLTLAGLVLKGGRQRTLLLKDEAQIVLEDVAIRESGGPGAALFGKSRLTAARCSLSANRTHGLELHGQSAATLTDSDLHANVQSGAAGFDESTATFSDCRLVNNGEWNVVLSHNAQAELSGCLLQQGRFAGLDVSDSAQARCRDCRIEDGRRFGAFATGSSTLELTRTSVRRNGGRGIEAQDRARLTLDEARIEDNRDYGVILFGQTAVKAVRSTFTGNGAHGASLRGPASGVFLQCGFSRNRYSGVGCLDGRDGGRVKVSACTFTRNGMRPIYRGPLHIDPLVPTPLAVNGRRVECLADPNAVIELYLDRIGEASRYLRAVRADGRGRFQVDGSEVPAGWVMTASATVHEATSEFNVVAGTAEDVVLGALLGRTGVFSDDGGEPDAESLVRRWRPGT
ncbi:MAG: right-handed parallel beta-helix repeat-containing protein, partial [Phycisphaerae bacterium]